MTRPSTPASGGQPKIMSSRLMTMKFMQRAAASSHRSPSTTANTPNGDTASSPSTKRQKLTDSEPSTPGSPAFATSHSTDMRVVSAALAAEEKLRSEARLRSAAAGGETEWTLNLPSAAGSMAGNSVGKNSGADPVREDEPADDEIWQDRTIGRRSYGNFKRKKIQVGAASSKQAGEEDDEELSEADVSDLESGVHAQPTKRPMRPNLEQERADEKRWLAMDKMNLKKQNHISGFVPKRALDDRSSRMKRNPRHSSNS